MNHLDIFRCVCSLESSHSPRPEIRYGYVAPTGIPTSLLARTRPPNHHRHGDVDREHMPIDAFITLIDRGYALHMGSLASLPCSS